MRGECEFIPWLRTRILVRSWSRFYAHTEARGECGRESGVHAEGKEDAVIAEWRRRNAPPFVSAILASFSSPRRESSYRATGLGRSASRARRRRRRVEDRGRRAGRQGA